MTGAGFDTQVLLGIVVFFITATPTVAAVNFTQCYLDFQTNETNRQLYGYHGRTYGGGILEGSPLLSVQGCKALCGSGPQLYLWKQSASTITTWVLPMIGLLLQAPFESNAKRRTFLALIRWAGSPIAALFHVLWNIKNTAKCALMVDMSVPYRDFPSEDSDFGQMRDSFGILSVMNQFSVDPTLNAGAGEKLIRIALFSNELVMTDGGPTLAQRRRDLATNVREGRRRGVVPVFITIMWFIFALVLSLADAFDNDNIGNNQLAHNLAMGLLLSWIPILILTGIVDRNPSATKDTRLRLNALVDDTRRALLLPQNQETIVLQGGGWREHYPWLDEIERNERFSEFFTAFAGQGRLRMHFGIAHPILSNIEFSYVGQHGRNWLEHERDARWALVYGYVNPRGLFHFDFREIWQILCSVLIVDGTVAGAFIISFRTPTVGLGCRSGGYMIFMVMTGALLTAELVVWALTSRTSPIRNVFGWILSAGELISASWLVYIVLAQTFGVYRNCACMASTWGGRGGYINTATSDIYSSPEVRIYWGLGTTVTCTIMGLLFAFIVAEWCEQSHLHTQTYRNAMQGLRHTRTWKRLTIPLRHVPDRIIESFKWLIGRRERRSMIWTVHSRRQRAGSFEDKPSRTSSRKPFVVYHETSLGLSPMSSPSIS